MHVMADHTLSLLRLQFLVVSFTFADRCHSMPKVTVGFMMPSKSNFITGILNFNCQHNVDMHPIISFYCTRLDGVL